MTTAATIQTWKVRTTARGVALTINGTEYELGATAHALAFDVARAAEGWNAPGTTNTVCVRPTCRASSGQVNHENCPECRAAAD